MHLHCSDEDELMNYKIILNPFYICHLVKFVHMSLGHMLNQAYRFYILRVNLVPFKLNTNTNTKLVYLKRTCFSRTFLDSKEKL